MIFQISSRILLNICKDKDDYIIPEWLFDEKKLIILRLQFSESNKKITKVWSKSSFYLQIVNLSSIVWNTINIRSLFQIKDNVKHYSCVAYEENCLCGENHVKESFFDDTTAIGFWKKKNENDVKKIEVYFSCYLKFLLWLIIIKVRLKSFNIHFSYDHQSIIFILFSYFH